MRPELPHTHAPHPCSSSGKGPTNLQRHILKKVLRPHSHLNMQMPARSATFLMNTFIQSPSRESLSLSLCQDVCWLESDHEDHHSLRRPTRRVCLAEHEPQAGARRLLKALLMKRRNAHARVCDRHVIKPFPGAKLPVPAHGFIAAPAVAQSKGIIMRMEGPSEPGFLKAQPASARSCSSVLGGERAPAPLSRNRQKSRERAC